MEEIIVSVELLAYNHEKTIARALDSILSQKTQYRFEIVVGEDCSTDGTANIVRVYAEKYPDIIVPLLRKKNLGVQENAIDILKHCRGKYIAVCEGDDYWCVDDKLEKQISFLENNSDYYLCSAKCKYFLNGVEEKSFFSDADSVSVKDKLNGGAIKRYASCTYVYRNIGYDEYAYDMYRRSICGDIIGETIAITRGKIHVLDYVVGVYERVDNSSKEIMSFSSNPIEKQVIEIRKAIMACKEITGKKYNSEWEKYEATFNRGIFWEKSKEVGVNNAWKYIRENISASKRYYLLRLLLIDYFEYKKNNKV